MLDGKRLGVDQPLERRRSVERERDVGELDRLAFEQALDARGDVLDPGRRIGSDTLRMAARNGVNSRALVGAGQRRSGDRLAAPGERTCADRGAEDGASGRR
jgi:hypothetical protein